MSHNLFGKTMAFVGKTPWHGLGTPVPAGVGSAAMIRAANLDWKVRKEPAPGARVIHKTKGRDVYERYAVTRDRVGEETVAPMLGIVKDAYELVQNDEAFAFFDPLISASQARYEAAGALGNGERVWVQVRVGGTIEVAEGDAVQKFLLLANSHDGSGSLSLRFTPIRVVCENTLNWATQGGEHVVKLRHSRRVHDRLGDHQTELLRQLIDDTFNRMAKDFRRLAAAHADAARRARFLEALFSTKSDPKGESPIWQQRIDAVLADKKVTPAASRHSMWALYNAVTRAEDYRETRETNAEARLERVWFGSGADLKIKALHAALALCG